MLNKNEVKIYGRCRDIGVFRVLLEALMYRINIHLVLTILIVLMTQISIYARNIYVDNTLGSDITNGTYSIDNRNNSGSDGDAYQLVQDAVNAMDGGDDIFIRGGVYREGLIKIPLSKNGTEGNWSSLQSYTNEWAILDGNHECDDWGGSVLGFPSSDYGSTDLKYWLFERLEIRNGRNPNNTVASGIWINGGPFIIRYCYIHDNVSSSAGNNPCGVKGLGIHDSKIEYCYFSNNGLSSGNDENAANIAFYSDYDDPNIAENGFTLNEKRSYKNEVAYNIIENACVGFKYKGRQLLSGRDTGSANGFDETYSEYGDKIHHNIFMNIRVYGIAPKQDFIQVYNNIIEVVNSNSSKGITVNYEPGRSLYKTCIYNNTIQNANQFGISHYKSPSPSDFQPHNYYGYDYNNIIDNCGSSGYGIMVVRNTSSYYGSDTYDVSQYFNSNNYFYRPPADKVIIVTQNTYAAEEFMSQSLTHSSENSLLQ